MIKKIYTITGFDCANCAAKAEAHLAKQDGISYVHLDFATNKLYITYKNNSWPIEELKRVISEVESDPLNINESSSKNNGNYKIFNKKMWILLGRIIFSVVIILVNIFLLGSASLNWLRFALYVISAIIIGYDIVYKVFSHIRHKTNILDHNLLILIAALGSLTLSIIALVNNEVELIKISETYYLAFDEAMEAVMVITLFQIGSIIESVATNKSKAAIMSAVELRVDKANLISDEGIVIVKPEDLKIDDTILITVGELIPVDGKIIEGECYIDTSSLTGEFVPVRGNIGDEIFSGCIIKDGSIKVKVTKKYKDSTINKIIELISSGGEKKSKADEFIAKFAKIYTPIVVGISLLTLLIGGLVTFNWLTWLHTGLEILVIGCPCAIVISVPLAYFSAIGLASKNGIVVKGANYLDELVKLKKLVTDKTGTLTHGSFTIQTIKPINISKDELLKSLYAVECLSTHPIAKAICHGVKTKKLANEQKNFLEIPGYGNETTYKNHLIIAGNEKMMIKHNIKYETSLEIGTVVHCAIDNKYVGYVVLADIIKEDAQPMIDLLHHEKVEIILLTGDHEDNARDICNKLGIDRWHSELLPEQKTKILEQEMDDLNGSFAFLGDGINDAPSIIRSDIGIAMGGIGSDIAVENADIVIMNDDPAKVYDAIKVAKLARARSVFNIVFALTIKVVVFLLALIFTITNFEAGENIMMYIAVLADTGLTVVLVINSLLLLYRKINRPSLNKK